MRVAVSYPATVLITPEAHCMKNPSSEGPQGFLRLLVNPNVHHRIHEPIGCNLQPPSFKTHYYEVYYPLFYP